MTYSIRVCRTADTNEGASLSTARRSGDVQPVSLLNHRKWEDLSPQEQDDENERASMNAEYDECYDPEWDA